jgi:hypothetical protein
MCVRTCPREVTEHHQVTGAYNGQTGYVCLTTDARLVAERCKIFSAYANRRDMRHCERVATQTAWRLRACGQRSMGQLTDWSAKWTRQCRENSSSRAKAFVSSPTSARQEQQTRSGRCSVRRATHAMSFALARRSVTAPIPAAPKLATRRTPRALATRIVRRRRGVIAAKPEAQTVPHRPERAGVECLSLRAATRALTAATVAAAGQRVF